jgi:glycerophosphoryl diester phosphodiesterase
MLNQCKIISFWEPYINYFIKYNKTHTPIALQQLANWYANASDVDNNSDYQTIINRGVDLSAADSMTAYNGNLPDGEPSYLPITKEMIHYAHVHGVKFGAWTVNIESVAIKLISWGVDYITTDYYRFVKSINDEPPRFD